MIGTPGKFSQWMSRLPLSGIAIPGLVALSALSFLVPLVLAAQTVSTLPTGDFDASGSLSVNAEGNIFITEKGDRSPNLGGDFTGTRVYKVTPQGNLSVFATLESVPVATAIHPDGTLYVSTFTPPHIWRISASGSASVFTDIGPSATEMIFADDGTLYVAHCNEPMLDNISRVTPAGAVSEFAASAILRCPVGITLDNENNVYASNRNNGGVVKITQAGVVTRLATTPASSAIPSGRNSRITFGNGRLYVVSHAVNQVFEILLDGTTTVLAGSGVRGRANGPALQAEFSLPWGIDLSPDGTKLYINDTVSLVAIESQWHPNNVRVVDLENTEPVFSINPGLNGNWWKGLDRSGEGAQIEVAEAGDGSLLLVATFYSYDTLGNQIFLIAVGTVNGNTADVDVFITEGGIWGDNFNPADVNETQWGTGTFIATNCDAMHMSLTPNAEFQGIGYTHLEYDLIRLTTPAAPCPTAN